MNTKTFLALSIGLIFLLSSVGFGANSTAPAVPHTTYPAAANWVPNAPYSCANPMDESNVTQIFAIQAGSITPKSMVSFNTSGLYANLGACIKIVLVDVVPIHHDFTIDKVSSTGNTNNSIDDANLNKAELNSIDMDTDNNTANVGFGPGINVFYSWMPKVKSKFLYFCGQPGHEDTGMKGYLYVGYTKPTPITTTPGFQIVSVMLAFIGVATMDLIYNKKRRH